MHNIVKDIASHGKWRIFRQRQRQELPLCTEVVFLGKRGGPTEAVLHSIANGKGALTGSTHLT